MLKKVGLTVRWDRDFPCQTSTVYAGATSQTVVVAFRNHHAWKTRRLDVAGDPNDTANDNHNTYNCPHDTLSIHVSSLPALFDQKQARWHEKAPSSFVGFLGASLTPLVRIQLGFWHL